MVLLLFQHTSYPSECGSRLSIMEKVGSRVASSSMHSTGSISTLESTTGGLWASSHTNQSQFYFTMENPLLLGALRLNAFNHPWIYQVTYVFPPPALVTLFLSKFQTEHVTGQFKCLILVAPCWKEVPWPPTVLNMLEDIPHWCPIVKSLVMDDLVGWFAERSTIVAFNPLAAQTCVWCRQGFPSSVWQVVTVVYLALPKITLMCI